MEAEYTIDSIWNDRVRVMQSSKGYRFSLDAVLLAHFLQLEKDEDALEIGCGNGIILVLLSRLRQFRKIVGVEIQKEPAALAKKNVEMNHINNVHIVNADIRRMPLQQHSFDLVYANPPYRKTGTGKLNPQKEKSIARHEVSLRLEEVFSCAEALMKENGRFTLILPAFRQEDFDHLTQKFNLRPNQLWMVRSFAGEAPKFFLSTLSRHGSVREYPPLILFESPGVRTPEWNAMLTEPQRP